MTSGWNFKLFLLRFLYIWWFSKTFVQPFYIHWMLTWCCTIFKTLLSK